MVLMMIVEEVEITNGRIETVIVRIGIASDVNVKVSLIIARAKKCTADEIGVRL